MDNLIRLYTKKQSETVIEILLKGNDEALELLENGININTRNDDGDTALLIAAKQDNVEVFKFLLDQGAEFPRDQRPGILRCSDMDTKDALLRWACEKGLERVVEFLAPKIIVGIRYMNYLPSATKGGNVNIVEYILRFESDIKLDQWSYEGLLENAVCGGYDKVVEMLLNRGANVITPNQLNLLLHCASEKGLENIVKLLLKSNANVWALFNEGKTVLHSAASGGNENIVKLFLDMGLKANVKDNDGWTPLSYVKGSGNIIERIIVLLLNHGADVNTKMKLNPCKSILNFACANGYEETVKLLLVKGADIIGEEYKWDREIFYFLFGVDQKIFNARYYDYGFGYASLDRRNYRQTALHSASRSNNEEIIKLLIAYGADPNAETSEGYRPLHIASRCGHESIVKILIERGADVNAKSCKGETALHSAICSGNQDIVTFFLNQGLDIHDKVGYFGFNALHWAAYHGHESIAELLLSKHGAHIDIKTITRGKTALDIASNRKHLNVVKVLLKQGVSILDKSCHFVFSKKIYRELLDSGLIDVADGNNYARTELELFLEGPIDSRDDDYRDINFPGPHRNWLAKRAEQILDYGLIVNLDTVSIALGDVTGIILELLLNYTRHLNLTEGINSSESVACQTLRIDSYSSRIAPQLIIRHITEMASKNQLVSQEYLDRINSNENWKSFETKCQLEIEKLKSETFAETTVCPYNIVICKDPTQLAAYARNEKVLQQVSSVQCLMKYPIYASALNNQLRRGKWRFLLLDSVKYFFSALTKSEGNEGLPRLPVVCVQMIYSYLNNRDLMRLIRVCNVPFNTDICDVEI